MNYKKTKKRESIALVFVAAIAILISANVLYAKYYKNYNKKGVTMASAYYFKSDVLFEYDKEKFDITDSEDISNCDISEKIEDGKVKEKLPVIYKSALQDKAFSCDINIRNYLNQLAYNDSTLNIKYKIYFKLVKIGQMESTSNKITQDSTQQETINVKVSSGVGQSEELQMETVKSYDGELIGGAAHDDKYVITFETVNENYGVKIWVVVNEPSYIANSKILAGIISARVSSETNEVSGEFTSKEGYAYGYTIKTEGVSKEYYLEWNSDKIEINPQDKLFVSKDSQENGFIQGTISDSTTTDWKKVDLNLQPYSQFNITFFKKSSDINNGDLGNYVRLKEKMNNT